MRDPRAAEVSAPGAAEVPPDAFRALPSLRLHLLVRQIEREAEAEYLHTFGLRLVECRIIGMAGGAEPVTLKRVCADLGLDKAHASRVVAGLVTRGLLRREANAADGRAPALRPTAEGALLRARIYGVAAARNERLMAAIPERRRGAFLRDLDRLVAACRAEAPNAAEGETTTSEAA